MSTYALWLRVPIPLYIYACTVTDITSIVTRQITASKIPGREPAVHVLGARSTCIIQMFLQDPGEGARSTCTNALNAIRLRLTK